MIKIPICIVTQTPQVMKDFCPDICIFQRSAGICRGQSCGYDLIGLRITEFNGVKLFICVDVQVRQCAFNQI